MGCGSGHECEFCGACIKCSSHYPWCPMPLYEASMTAYQKLREHYVTLTTASLELALREAQLVARDQYTKANPPPTKPERK